jgi:hypothetical protein
MLNKDSIFILFWYFVFGVFICRSKRRVFVSFIDLFNIYIKIIVYGVVGVLDFDL